MWHDITEEEYNQESKASSTQISIIEGLLITANISEDEKIEIDKALNRLSEEEAYKTIQYLKENNIETNPVKQWENNIKKY